MPKSLERILRAQRDRYAKVLIIIEGAYSMDGDIADVPAFVAVKKKYGCFLMVDEAHTTCVIGKTGGGVDEYFGLAPDDIDIKMGTLSKGLGTCGGYLAGRESLITYLRYNLPGFVFSVGISPPLAGRDARQHPSDAQISADHGAHETQYRHASWRRRRSATWTSAWRGIRPSSPCWWAGTRTRSCLSNMMREHGVFVPPAVYPAVPKNKARLRFCVISEHKPEQIVKALDTLLELAKEAGITLPSPQ